MKRSNMILGHIKMRERIYTIIFWVTTATHNNDAIDMKKSTHTLTYSLTHNEKLLDILW